MTTPTSASLPPWPLGPDKENPLSGTPSPWRRAFTHHPTHQGAPRTKKGAPFCRKKIVPPIYLFGTWQSSWGGGAGEGST